MSNANESTRGDGSNVRGGSGESLCLVELVVGRRGPGGGGGSCAKNKRGEVQREARKSVGMRSVGRRSLGERKLTSRRGVLGSSILFCDLRRCC